MPLSHRCLVQLMEAHARASKSPKKLSSQPPASYTLPEDALHGTEGAASENSWLLAGSVCIFLGLKHGHALLLEAPVCSRHKKQHAGVVIAANMFL